MLVSLEASSCDWDGPKEQAADHYAPGPRLQGRNKDALGGGQQATHQEHEASSS